MFKFFVFTSFLVFFVHYSIQQNCSNPVNLLQITDLPILDTADSGFKSQNVLSLVIMATQVDNRTDAIITLNATSPNCNYPGPNWVKTIVNCTEIWNATIPWQIAYQECGLNRTETAQSITFDGWIDVFQQDILGTIRGTPITRNLSTNFEYKVVFPKTLSVQSTIQVFAPILVDAAIVSESYDATAMQGQLNLFSSVQWPFELVQPQVAINSTQLFPTIANLSQDCANNSACSENWNISIALSNICNFSGTYAASYQIICNPLYTGQCPLQGENATVIFSIVSQDVCGVFTENIDLNGTLNSYLSDFATERAAFIIGQVSYWKLDVYSTKATIISTDLLGVSTQFGLTNATLFNLNQTTSTGNVTNFSSISSSATEVRFQFNVDPAVFPIATDQNAPATVVALVSVNYQNTQQQKRSVLRELLLHPLLSNNKNSKQSNNIYQNNQNTKRQIPSSQAQSLSSSSVMTVQGLASTTTQAPATSSSSSSNPTLQSTLSSTSTSSSSSSQSPSSTSSTQPTIDKNAPSTSSSFPIWMWIVIAVASLSCIALVVLLAILFSRRKNRSQKLESQQSSSTDI